MPVTLKTILAAIELGPSGERVCEYAAELARSRHGRVVVLHVVEGLEMVKNLRLPYVPYDDELIADVKDRAMKNLKAFARQHLGEIADSDLRVEHGDAFEGILRAAAELPADLIVMGTHGRRGLDRTLFGSTAERVLRRARVPVLTVPFLE